MDILALLSKLYRSSSRYISSFLLELGTQLKMSKTQDMQEAHPRRYSKNHSRQSFDSFLNVGFVTLLLPAGPLDVCERAKDKLGLSNALRNWNHLWLTLLNT